MRLVGDSAAISRRVQDEIAALLGAIGEPDVPEPASGRPSAPATTGAEDAPVTPVTGGGQVAALGAGAALLGNALGGRGRAERDDPITPR